MNRCYGRFSLFVWLTVCLLQTGVACGDIDNLSCTVTSPTDFTKNYNNGQEITLSATWQGDTPPFAATFKANGSAIGTSNTDGNTAQFSLSAANLKEGDNNFAVSVLETAVPNANGSGDVNANGSITVDRTSPTLTLTVTSGNIVSPNQGTNEVTLQFTSSEGLGEAPQFTVTPGNIPLPTPVGTPNPPFTSGQYRITVPTGTSGGTYFVSVTGKDNTEPVGNRNTGTAQTSFVVDAAADGAPTISSANPPSPCRSQNLVLSGSITPETGAQKVEIVEGGAVKATVGVAANTDTWTVVLVDVTEGPHKYAARRIDPLGNTSPSGTELSVVVDRTSPVAPALDAFAKPVNTRKVTITGKGVSDSPYDSKPIKVTLFRNGTQIASTTAGTDGRFSVDVDLESGQNIILARSADTTWSSATDSSGNESGFSPAITITLDQSAPVIVSGGIVISSNGSGGTPVRPAGPPAVVYSAPPPSAPPQASVVPPTSVSAPFSTPASSAVSPGETGQVVPSADGNASGPVLAVASDAAVASDEEAFDLVADETVPEEPEEEALDSGAAGLAPPVGRLVPGPLIVRLPLESLRDRSTGTVQGWVVCRQLSGLSAGGFFSMSAGDNALEVVIPLAGPLAYRIMLRDAAGNVSSFPPQGEFLRQNRRSESLMLSEQGTMWGVQAPYLDEWPVEPLGLPPVERLLAYRFIQVPQPLAVDLAGHLSNAGAEGLVQLVPPGSPAVSMSGYMNDLRLLREGRLPVQRFDLLRQEIVNLQVPEFLLPAPESLPDQPQFKSLREAIQFRRLHERPR